MIMNDETYEQLLAKITHPKQRAFLENYPTFMTVIATAEATGISEVTPYDWCLTNEDYLQAFQALKKQIDATRLEKYEKELDKRALGGVSKSSDILLMFGLKALHPAKYRDNPSIQPMIGGNVSITWNIPAYTDTPLPPPQIVEGERVTLEKERDNG